MDNTGLAKFEEYLGGYGPQLYDGWGGEPVAWGRKIVRHMGDELFAELRQLGQLECSYPNWFFIDKTLSLKDAIKKYGKPKKIVTGPRGGTRTITLGKTTFSFKHGGWDTEARELGLFGTVETVIEK